MAKKLLVARNLDRGLNRPAEDVKFMAG